MNFAWNPILPLLAFLTACVSGCSADIGEPGELDEPTEDEVAQAATSVQRVVRLDVTDGSVSGSDGRFHVDAAAMRAIALSGSTGAASPVSASKATLQATYRGPTTTSIPTGSGEIRHQLGLKLLNKNPCNLLYAMVRVAENGQGRLVVQTKVNDGASTSEQCGNAGYADVGSINVGPVALHVPHELHASWNAAQRTMTFDLDGGAPLRVTLDRATVARLGRGLGVRTDNAIVDFRLLYAP